MRHDPHEGCLSRKYIEVGDMELLPIRTAFDDAAARPYAVLPTEREDLILGEIPLVPYLFPSWRWAHTGIGDPHARRISSFVRHLRENPSGACLQGAGLTAKEKGTRPNFVDLRGIPAGVAVIEYAKQLRAAADEAALVTLEVATTTPPVAKRRSARLAQ